MSAYHPQHAKAHRRPLAVALAAVVLAVAALIATAATPALAAPARRAQAVLCDRHGHGRCLTVGAWHRRAWLRTGHGTPVRITPAGQVTPTWPFRHSPALNGVLAGLRTVQIRAGRWCIGGTGNGTVRLMRCSALTEWVRGWFAAGIWVSVRASDATGLPAALAVTSPARGQLVCALTLNGHALGLQQWRPGRAHRH